MFFRTKESLRLSLYTARRCIGFSCSRGFHVTNYVYLRKVGSSRRKSAKEPDYESSSSVAGELHVTAPPRKVNNNFYGIESDEGVIEIDDKPSLKYDGKRQIFNIDQEKIITTTFGTVRYDSDNKSRYGQLEKEKIQISSEVAKHKIRDLSQMLVNKSTIKSHNVPSSAENSTEAAVTDLLDRNLKSRLPNSSFMYEFPDLYVNKDNCIISVSENQPLSSADDTSRLPDSSSMYEVHFPDTYAKKDNCVASESENSPSSSDDDKSRLTNSSYVDELHFADLYVEKDSCDVSKLESTSCSSADDKSNFIEESYFSGKTTDECILKNANIASENVSSSDKFHISPVQEMPTECVTDDRMSFFDENYFNVPERKEMKITDQKNLESVTKIINVMEEKSNQENAVRQLRDEKISVFDKNLFITESENGVTHSKILASDTKLCMKDMHDDKNTEMSMSKALYDSNENYMDVSNEQLSLKLVNPNLEELEGSNKFKSSLKYFPNKKNKFMFESKEFLKESELKNCKLKKSSLFQKNLDEADIVKIQNEKEVVKSPQEVQVLKVEKEASVENLKNNEQPETAYDFVKKLRSSKKKLGHEFINGKFIQKTEQYDSKGFRILKNQVPNLNYYTRDEMLDILVKNVLYSDDDLIVLNKPYNLVMHESKTVKDPCLSQYLDDLAALLDKKTCKPKLITVHRLDKETSGCLLLARNEISAQKFLSLFSERKIIKTYWIVTIKVPDPLEGIIDMPVSEGSVGGKARMVLHPDLPRDIPYQNHSKCGKRAVTRYKVIAESGNAALVEAYPETGIKHQIRVHFGFGLSCPILGDHKYSHLDKLVPQKLQADLLQKLLVRQSKVRHIPMHMYARSILIPQYKDGRNLFVMAPMPIHMSKNLQRLKFKKN